jgi:CRP/FNR family cyclic AMP-dependent transcriptional regulator
MRDTTRPDSFDPQIFFSQITTGRTSATYRLNETVFSQGDAADSVLYLQDGKAKKTVTAKDGKEAVLAILGPGDFFGECCLKGLPQRMMSVTAITECSVLQLEKAAMERALREEPKFAGLFIDHLLQRNWRVEADLADQLFNSSEKRLARALWLLANSGKDEQQASVITEINQETLAEMIGTTRSRVNFFMNKFRRLGFIDYSGDMRGELRVHPSLLNVVLNDHLLDREP